MHQAQVNIAFFSKIGQLSLGDWKQSEGEKKSDRTQKENEACANDFNYATHGVQKTSEYPSQQLMVMNMKVGWHANRKLVVENPENVCCIGMQHNYVARRP